MTARGFGFSTGGLGFLISMEKEPILKNVALILKIWGRSLCSPKKMSPVRAEAKTPMMTVIHTTAHSSTDRSFPIRFH